MTYYDTPLLNDKQDVTQPLIRQNFQQLQNTIAIDHYGPNDLTVNNGYHNKVTTPSIASVPLSTATYDVFYGFKQTNPLGILQYSRGWNSGLSLPSVPTPLTCLQSPATAISLNASQTTDILDFTGLSGAIANLYAYDAETPFTIQNQLAAFVTWDGTNLIPSAYIFGNLRAVKTGNILQIQNSTGGTLAKVFWTLHLVRTQ